MPCTSMLLGGPFHSGAPRLCLPCLPSRDATAVSRKGMSLSKCAMPRKLHTSSAFSSHSITFCVASPLNSGISRKTPSHSPPLFSKAGIACSENAIQTDTNVLYIQGLMSQLTETHLLSQAPTIQSPKMSQQITVHIITLGNVPTSLPGTGKQ